MAGRRNGHSASTGDFLTALRSFKENKPNDFNTLMDQMCELATVWPRRSKATGLDGRWWCEFLEKLGRGDWCIDYV